MNRPPEHDDLLDDLLAESAPADFRDALLADTLRQVRRRRWTRRASRAGLAVAAACVAGLLMWRSAPRHAPADSSVAACPVVHTQPLPPGAMVSTRPPGAVRIIATFSSVGVVHTRPGAGNLNVINDDDLLALAAPHQPALVRTGPHTQQLILLAPVEPDARRVN